MTFLLFISPGWGVPRGGSVESNYNGVFLSLHTRAHIAFAQILPQVVIFQSIMPWALSRSNIDSRVRREPKFFVPPVLGMFLDYCLCSSRRRVYALSPRSSCHEQVFSLIVVRGISCFPPRPDHQTYLIHHGSGPCDNQRQSGKLDRLCHARVCHLVVGMSWLIMSYCMM